MRAVHGLQSVVATPSQDGGDQFPVVFVVIDNEYCLVGIQGRRLVRDRFASRPLRITEFDRDWHIEAPFVLAVTGTASRRG